jgi:FkbM family methyltransferase
MVDNIARHVAPITRRIRFPGRERILRLVFPPEKFRMAGRHREFTINYDGDLKFRCDPGSYIEWSVFFKGYYNPDLSLAIKKLVEPGMQTIDVGANVGAYTLLIAKQAGTNGRVISIEPNPEVFKRLEYNITLNNLQNHVATHQIALSDHRGEAILFTPQAEYINRGISSLQQYSEYLTEQTMVGVQTLDDFFADLKLDHLDFLKIDTDGSDALIINGGLKTITHFRPRIIFEANYIAHSEPDEAMERVHQELKKLDYQFFTVGYFGKLLPCPNSQFLPDNDIICIPKRV